MPDDEQRWTPLLGLRRAATTLAIRAVVLLALWIGGLWLITPLLNALPAHWATFGFVAVAMVVPAFIIGGVLGHKLIDKAGMGGLPLSLMAMAFGWAVAALGVVIVHALREIGDWQRTLTLLAVGVWVTGWMIKAVLLES